jgi:LAO/AO transport system kinase
VLAVARSLEEKAMKLLAVAAGGEKTSMAHDMIAVVDMKTSERGSLSGLQLDHLGVAVKSIASAREFYGMLGMVVTHQEQVDHEQVRVAMLPMGESRLELLEATTEDSVIGRFVAKRGEGLHHVALRTGEIDALFARLKENGVRLASDAIRTGAGGHRYFFVHPESTGGVLVEIVGEG